MLKMISMGLVSTRYTAMDKQRWELMCIHSDNSYQDNDVFFSISIVIIFSSPEHNMLRLSYCDRPFSVVRRRGSSVVRRASCVVRQLFLLKHLLLWNRSLGTWPNFTGMIPRRSSTKIVQTVPVGCICRSRGQK